MAFDAGNVRAMQDELEKAKAEAALRISVRYDGYTQEEKRKVEETYGRILGALHELGIAT